MEKYVGPDRGLVKSHCHLSLFDNNNAHPCFDYNNVHPCFDYNNAHPRKSEEAIGHEIGSRSYHI